jgi:hypothetical protein
MYGVSLDDVVKMNNISDRTTIIVGQRLVLPAGAGTLHPASTPATAAGTAAVATHTFTHTARPAAR